jgi:hypothetical protein
MYDLQSWTAAYTDTCHNDAVPVESVTYTWKDTTSVITCSPDKKKQLHCDAEMSI